MTDHLWHAGVCPTRAEALVELAEMLASKRSVMRLATTPEQKAKFGQQIDALQWAYDRIMELPR